MSLLSTKLVSKGSPPYVRAHFHTSRANSASLQFSQALRCAPTWNPQNVPNPQCCVQVLPSPELTAKETVIVQLDALKNNNQPWANHGIQTMYEFGADIGGLEPSWYFGFQKDLYHMDHFMGQFTNLLGELIDCKRFEVRDVSDADESNSSHIVQLQDNVDRDFAVVLAWVDADESSGGEKICVEFQLARRTFGSKKGAYMTKMVKKVNYL